MNPAVTNLMISLGAMQLAKKVPFDDPTVLMAVRIGYLTSQAICIGVYLYISYKVSSILSSRHCGARELTALVT